MLAKLIIVLGLLLQTAQTQITELTVTPSTTVVNEKSNIEVFIRTSEP